MKIQIFDKLFDQMYFVKDHFLNQNMRSDTLCIYGNHYLDQQQSCFTSHCLLKYIFEYS